MEDTPHLRRNSQGGTSPCRSLIVTSRNVIIPKMSLVNSLEMPCIFCHRPSQAGPPYPLKYQVLETISMNVT